MAKDKPYNGGTWTVARYHSFIKGSLRSASVRWPPRYQVLNEAKLGKRVNPKTGRMAEHYRCASCMNAFPGKDVQVNHKIPVVPPSGFDSWDGVIKRLFCEKEHLEVLCIPCHASVTELENKERRIK